MKEHRLLHGSAWIVSGQFVSMAFQAAYFVLMGRTLGSREYGAFVGVVALVALLTQFSSAGMEMILLRNISRDRKSFAPRGATRCPSAPAALCLSSPRRGSSDRSRYARSSASSFLGSPLAMPSSERSSSSPAAPSRGREKCLTAPGSPRLCTPPAQLSPQAFISTPAIGAVIPTPTHGDAFTGLRLSRCLSWPSGLSRRTLAGRALFLF